MAQGHLDGRSLAAARAVTLDPVDHRLFVPDEYNHRVVVWQLDGLNRVAGRDARWVLGQPDLNTSLMGEPSAANMTTPIGSAYDTSTKRLFVGDGYHNRILVYEAAPRGVAERHGCLRGHRPARLPERRPRRGAGGHQLRRPHGPRHRLGLPAHGFRRGRGGTAAVRLRRREQPRADLRYPP